MHFREEAGGIIEPERHLPLRRETDVLVAGGGPAGICAALAAARTGARTVLIEHYGFLGGMWTAGLLNPLFEIKNKGAILADLIRRLKNAGGWGGMWDLCFDTETMKFQLDRMAAEAGVETLLYATVVETLTAGDVVRGLVVESKSGREALLAKVVIDCTGDGDATARAGASFEQGRSADGLTQPMTLMFQLSGVHYQQANDKALFQIFREFAPEEAKQLPYNRPWAIHLPQAGDAAVMMTHIHRRDGTNAEDLTAASVEGRRQVQEALALFRRCAPKFGDSVRLTATGAQIGVRETRRILGDYVLTKEDLSSARHFPDGLVSGQFPLDIHSPDSAEQFAEVLKKPYWIPYRCQLPKGLDGILTAGRCISGTHEAHASYRVTGICAGLGHAAGTAAALACRQKCTPRNLDLTLLKNTLQEQGFNFDEEQA
jgi:hypothetical protein